MRPQQPGRAKENSPPIYRWVGVSMETSPARDDRTERAAQTLLPSLPGLVMLREADPSVETLGYSLSPLPGFRAPRSWIVEQRRSSNPPLRLSPSHEPQPCRAGKAALRGSWSQCAVGEPLELPMNHPLERRHSGRHSGGGPVIAGGCGCGRSVAWRWAEVGWSPRWGRWRPGGQGSGVPSSRRAGRRYTGWCRICPPRLGRG